jgi:small subunit ribosomal protein S8e
MNQGRKISGGKYHANRKQKKFEIEGQPRIVKLGKEKKKKVRILSGKYKTVLLSTDNVNVYSPSTKKTYKVKIKNVVETPANKFMARQNVLMKSAIIDTEKGKARITNRPSQEATVQAELLNEAK